jgi:hypothetical protein
MQIEVIEKEIKALISEPGVQASALLDGGSGLIWCSASDGAVKLPNWEAAVDYWRLHHRMREHFVSLGELGAAVMYHQKAVMAVFPCARRDDLLVACIAKHSGVDWAAVQRRVRALGVWLQDQ